MGIPENIDAIMAEFDIPASSIARAAGVSEAAVSDWRNNGAVPRKQNVQRLCEYFGLVPDDILSDASGYARRIRGDAITKGFSPVPLLGRIAAGDPIPMEEYDDMREAPTKYKADDPDVFLLRIQGNSVNRIIKDGDFALISPKYREPNPHDLFAVCVDGYDATVKHVRVLENGLELVPDSDDPTYRPQVFDWNEDATDEVTIIGKVVWWCMAF